MLVDTIRNVVQERLSTVYTSIPGKVVKFNNGKADVEPLVNLQGDSKLPVLPDIPVVFPSSSTAGIVFEVAKDDTVLLVFSNSSLDEWLNGNGGAVDTDDPRRFDLTDAVAIPGLFSFTQAPELSATDGCVMSYDDTKITIKKSGDIQIGGVGATALVKDTFIDLYNAHTHICASPGSPTGVPTPPAVKATVVTSVVTAE